MAAIALLGIADALLMALWGRQAFGVAFSLLEVSWVAVSMLFAAIACRHGLPWQVPGLFLAYQLGAWFYGTWLLASTGELVLPAGMVALALLVYTMLAWLSWRRLQMMG